MLYRQTTNTHGHPRFAVHFLSLLTKAECNSDDSIPNLYALALSKAKKLGGKKYHNKKFGGGIIFTTFDEHELEKQLKELAGE
jgi:hypothetical protein